MGSLDWTKYAVIGGSALGGYAIARSFRASKGTAILAGAAAAVALPAILAKTVFGGGLGTLPLVPYPAGGRVPPSSPPNSPPRRRGNRIDLPRWPRLGPTPPVYAPALQSLPASVPVEVFDGSSGSWRPYRTFASYPSFRTWIIAAIRGGQYSPILFQPLESYPAVATDYEQAAMREAGVYAEGGTGVSPISSGEHAHRMYGNVNA